MNAKLIQINDFAIFFIFNKIMLNWLIGYYIVEFEQHGKDRAEYGTQLLKKL